MKQHTWWTAVVLVAVVTACGSDKSAPATTPATTSAASTTVPGPDLTPLLLTVDDLVGLDGEWTVMTDMSPDDLGSLASSPCPDTTLDPELVERLRPTAGVIFEPADGSMQGVQELILSGDPARLEADLEAVIGSVESCVGEQYEVPDTGEKVQYDLIDVGDLGDQRAVATVTAFEPPDFMTTWRGHTAIVRVGDTAIMVNQFQILDSPDLEPSMTDEEFVTLLQAAVAKLAG